MLSTGRKYNIKDILENSGEISASKFLDQFQPWVERRAGVRIDRDATHLHGIGNNNKFRLYEKNINDDLVLVGFLNITSAIYGGRVDIFVTDIEGNRRGQLYKIWPEGKIEIEKK